jgi:predicted nucleic acid-binding protein
MYLLDTNVLSELRRPARVNAGLARWAAATPTSDLFVSVVTVMAIELGVLRVERRDGAQGTRLRRWFEADVLGRFEDRTIGINLAVARCCANLHSPDPKPLSDSYIAATAIVHGLTVVTRNEADFRATGSAVLNPWSP